MDILELGADTKALANFYLAGLSDSERLGHKEFKLRSGVTLE